MKNTSTLIITVICYIIFVISWFICGSFGLLYICFSILMPEWVKLLFVILAFAVITYPIYARIYTIQKNPKRIYTAVILTVALALSFYLTHYGFFKYYSDFTPSKWHRVNHDVRQYMIDSLEEKYNIIGMTQEEITELLGTPDYSQDNEYRHDEYQPCYYEYIISYAMIDPVVYRINFDNETVVFADIKIYN